MQSLSGPTRIKPAEMVKPRAFVLDFVGIFDKLENTPAFNSDERSSSLVATRSFTSLTNLCKSHLANDRAIIYRRIA